MSHAQRAISVGAIAFTALTCAFGCSSDEAPSSPPGVGGSHLANSSGNAGAGGTTAATGGITSTAGGAAPSAAGTTSGGNTAANAGAGGASGGGGTAGSNDATSGSSGAAGASGAGGATNGGSAGAGGGAPCVTAGSELCDGFESGQIDATRWKLTKPTSSASITVDSEHVRSGQHAVHIKVVPGQQSTAMLTEQVTFPAPQNSFYARAYFYFSPDLPESPGGDFHMGFIFGIGKNDAGDVQAGMGMIGGERQYLGYSIFFGPPKYEFGPWSQAKVQPGQWQCIELFEDGSSPSEEKRRVWLDGTELTDLRSTSANQGAPANHKPPAFDGVSFGLWEYHPSPLLSDIWLDDIRVSSTPIGCQ
jgi:hypothetical protein